LKEDFVADSSDTEENKGLCSYHLSS